MIQGKNLAAGLLVMAVSLPASAFLDGVRDRLDRAQGGLDRTKDVVEEPERRQRDAERRQRELEAKPEQKERELRKRVDDATSISD